MSCRYHQQESSDYRLEGMELFLPLSDLATHRVEFDGPALSKVALRLGCWSVDHGVFDDRPAHLALAEASTGFRRGQVWQVQVAFSGAIQHRMERTAYGRTYLGGGELLQAGEIVLGLGEAYHSPWVVWTWGDGLDAAAVRLHRHLSQKPRATTTSSSMPPPLPLRTMIGKQWLVSPSTRQRLVLRPSCSTSAGAYALVWIPMPTALGALSVDRLVISMGCWPGFATLILKLVLRSSWNLWRLVQPLPVIIPTGC